jgi:DNA-binding response OmpR family regulator
MKFLIVEDDLRLASILRRGLCEAGHVVDVEHDGVAGETCAVAGTYDAIILDVNLPRKSGFDVVRAIRERGTPTPVLLLTSRDTVPDTIAGLDAGADDYLSKPFVFGELHARLRSLTRRKAPPASNVLRVGDVTLDRATRATHRGPAFVALTARETAFLEYFMQNADTVLTQAMIEDALWEADRDTGSSLIRVYVQRLRAKLSPNGQPQLIQTIRGVGYRMSAR